LLASEEPMPLPLAAPDPPPIKQEPAVARFEPPPIDEIRERVLAAAPAPSHPEPPPIRHEPPGAVRRVARQVPTRRVQLSAPQQQPPQARPASDPLPFDAALSSILFSADRQLAIIDGRVVGRGDAVRDATVVEISAGVVLLRDSQGRLRRLSTGGAGR
jgi:hypothetical protein